MDFREYAQAFCEVERDFEQAVEAFGVPFEASESTMRQRRRDVAETCGCACENGDGSLWRNWISPACLACRTGDATATFFVDLRCTKKCYFCFNPNQDHYEYFLSHKRDIVGELEQAHAAGARFRCLAVTGGEPMLHKGDVLAFLRRANELFPGVHTRLYTSGDLLDAEGLRELARAGLSEIRFSIKPPDADEGQEAVYSLMEQAVGVIPAVVVEVPVIPGSLEAMQELLRRCDAIGIQGVNLLEFCFPLHNGEEFLSRGFRLRKHPYRHLYDYWYGGGVPVARSEDEALALLEFASREGLSLGVHYCSSDNKNTGQVYQQNRAFTCGGVLRAEHPWLEADEDDRFLKCAKAFGDDARAVRDWAAGEGLERFGFDAEVPCASFPLSQVSAVRAALPDVSLGVSANVVEEDGAGGFHLREVSVEPLG